MIEIITTIIICSLGAFMYWYYHQIYLPHTYGPLSKLPGERWPLWGRLKLSYHIIMGSRPQFIHKMHQKYGEVVLICNNMVSTIHKPDVDKIYSTYRFPKGEEYQNYSVLGGENIFSTSHKDFHLVRRRLIEPILTPSRVHSMQSTIYNFGACNLAGKIDQLIKASGEIDLFDLLHRANLDVTFQLFFGSDFRLIDWDWLPVISILKYGFFFLTNGALVPFFKLGANVLAGVIAMGLRVMWKFHPPKHDSFFHRLTNAKDVETGKMLNFVEIMREILVIMIAGMDTSSVTLTWTLWLILQDEKLYTSLIHELDNSDVKSMDLSTVDIDLLRSKLPILDSVIMEGMRLYPVGAAQLPRVTPSGGCTLNGYFIPENTIVLCSPFAYHRSPALWSNPDTFDPSRWRDPAHAAQLKSQMMTFSRGPRGCPGKHVAWAGIYTILTTLLGRYKLTLAAGQETLGDSPVTYLLLRPRAYALKVHAESK